MSEGASEDDVSSGNETSGESQRELAAALKHDLGKYVAWRSANLPESAWQGEPSPDTVAALQADILRTRSAPVGDEPAWGLFERHVGAWPRPWPDELVAVERAIATLRTHADALLAGDARALAPALPELRAAQSTIRSELAALVRRLAREE